MNTEVLSANSKNNELNKTPGDTKITHKEFLEKFELSQKMLSGMAIGAGVLLVSCYCIHIHFYPKGLTVGDSIVFLFAILSFGLLDVIGVFYCAVAGHWLMSLVIMIVNIFGQKSAQKRAEPFDPVRPKKLIGKRFSVLVSFIVFVIAISAFFDIRSRSEITANEWKLLVSFLLSGYLLNLGFAFESARKLSPRENKIKNVAILCIALLLPLFMGTWGTLLEKTMSLAGIRVMHHPIKLSKQNFETVSNYAKKFNVPIHDCGEESNGDHIVKGVNILWHGIGELAKLEIGTRGANATTPSPYVAFTIKDVDIDPIWASIDPCPTNAEPSK